LEESVIKAYDAICARFVGSSLAAAVLTTLSLPAAAADFTLGADKGVEGSIVTTVSLGTAIRMRGRDSELYQPANGNLQGLPTGVGGNSDDGELNFGRGDVYSTPLKLISELALKTDNYGTLVRVKAWYDYTLENRDVPHGNEANNYVANSKLSDEGLEPLQRFEGVYLLDAYVYGNWKTDGGNKFNLRLGRQALNWGESLFIQGVNQISPLDLTALHAPGTEIKEVLLPVGMIDGTWGIAGGPSIEAFYEFQWEPTNIDPCGTFFSSVDAGIGPNAGASGCDGGLVQAPDATNWVKKLYVPLGRTLTPSNGGQFGAAMRYYVPTLDTEFGLYAMDISARTPVLDGVRGTVPFEAQAPLGTVVHAYWQYPENIKIYGLSAATTIAKWSVGAELSFTPSYPTQIAAGDLVAALLYGPAGHIPQQFWGPAGPLVAATPVGGVVQGWTDTRKSQFQVNAVQAFANILGAQTFTVAGEAAVSYATGFTPGLRYGRGFVFGTAASPTFGPVNNAVPGGCPALNTPYQPGCVNEGFMTTTAWGYRLRTQLDYSNFMNSGMTLSPNLAWSQDVHGTSVDGQFIGGRQSLAGGFKLNYQKKYTLAAQYVWYANSAQWDPLRDRDNLSLSVSATF
jgi:Protein of unknown function (DUF1302)